MSKGLPRSLAHASPQRAKIIKQTIAIVDGAISVVGASGVGFGSLVAGDFPEGNVLFLGAVANMQFSGSGADAALVDTWAGDFGVGTTPASDGTISAADIDLIGSTAIAAAVAEASAVTRGVAVTATNAAVLDNTDGSLEINLSLLIDDASISGTVAITVNGEIYLSYVMLGDD